MAATTKPVTGGPRLAFTAVLRGSVIATTGVARGLISTAR